MKGISSLLLTITSTPGIEVMEFPSSSPIRPLLGLLQFLALTVGVFMFIPSLILVMAHKSEVKGADDPKSKGKGPMIFLIISIVCLVLVPILGILSRVIR